MARKRRYYREDRRNPVYLEEEWGDEHEDDDVDPDVDPKETDRFIKGASWGILIFLAVGALLSIAQSLYSPTYGEEGTQGYRVVSVSQGKLHTVELNTGKSFSFKDQDLVRQAINGGIKRGDVIYR